MIEIMTTNQPLFQFHKVQLKASTRSVVLMYISPFQFHKVQLKVTDYEVCAFMAYVSIP